MEEKRDKVVMGSELITEEGRTIIATTVISKIAGIAAKEIDGVHDLLTQGMSEAIAGLAQRVTRSDARGQGVRADIDGNTASIHMRITVDYGVSIVQLADALRRNVIDRVRAMTGIEVREVNIDVADLFFPELEEQSEHEQHRRVA